MKKMKLSIRNYWPYLKLSKHWIYQKNQVLLGPELETYDKYWDWVSTEKTLAKGFYDKGMKEGMEKGMEKGMEEDGKKRKSKSQKTSSNRHVIRASQPNYSIANWSIAND